MAQFAAIAGAQVLGSGLTAAFGAGLASQNEQLSEKYYDHTVQVQQDAYTKAGLPSYLAFGSNGSSALHNQPNTSQGFGPSNFYTSSSAGMSALAFAGNFQQQAQGAGEVKNSQVAPTVFTGNSSRAGIGFVQGPSFQGNLDATVASNISPQARGIYSAMAPPNNSAGVNQPGTDQTGQLNPHPSNFSTNTTTMHPLIDTDTFATPIMSSGSQPETSFTTLQSPAASPITPGIAASSLGSAGSSASAGGIEMATLPTSL
jgi:hypothetical protein